MERQARKAASFLRPRWRRTGCSCGAFALARRFAWNRPSRRGQSARASNRRKHVKRKALPPYRFSDWAAAKAGRHRNPLSPEIVTPHDPVRATHPTPEPPSPTNSRAHHGPAATTTATRAAPQSRVTTAASYVFSTGVSNCRQTRTPLVRRSSPACDRAGTSAASANASCAWRPGCSSTAVSPECEDRP